MIYVKENVKSRDIHVYISMENIQLAKGIEGNVEKKKVMSTQIKKSIKEAVM